MWARIRSWIRGVARRERVEQQLSDEMTFHLRARADHWVRHGLTAAEATRKARIEFGSVERYKDDSRQARGLKIVDEISADLTYALRKLRAAPAFALIATTILAVVIGANTAVFSVLEAVMLRSLPVHRPEELRELAWVEGNNPAWKVAYNGSMRPYPGGGRIATSFAYPVYVHVRDHTTMFTDLALFDRQSVNLGVAGTEHRAETLLVSGNFARGVGVRMRFGRAITPDDDRPGAPLVAVLTDRAWRRLLGGAPNAVGRSLTVNGAPAVVIGITASAFDGVEPGWPIDMMAPVVTALPTVERTRDVFADPKYWGFRVMGRVKAGTSDDGVRTETQALLRQALPSDLAGSDATLLPRVVVNPGGQGLDSLRRNYARPLYLLWSIMAAVLLVACANIAGLLLTRNMARCREFSIRLAIGAGRGRLIRQLLTESVVLSGIGGFFGVGLALAVRDRVLPALNYDDDPIDLVLGVDPSMLVFAIGLCLVVGLLCGILPAVRATRGGATPALARRSSTPAGAVSRLLAGKALIVAQVALSLVLIVGAGLFTRTLLNLRSEPLGFRPDHLLLFQLDPIASGYGERARDFYDRALERIAAVPGVSAVSMSRYGLLSGGATRDDINVPGAPNGEDAVGVHLHFVAPRYFETMGIPIVAGRDLAAPDREAAPRVAVINRALAARLPSAAAVVGGVIRYDDKPVQIVAIAADARFAGLREPAPPTLYLPYRQYTQRRMTMAVRVAGDPSGVAFPIRQAIEEIDRKVPVFDMRTQEAQIDRAVRQERLFAYVGSAFAVLALLLACLGIYGTLSYAVVGRTSEIGLRMALGASRWSVVSMVLRDSLMPVLVGVVCGLAMAMTTTRFVQSMLFGLTPDDALTLLAATGALVGSAFVAAWLPSRRASRVDPTVALRCE